MVILWWESPAVPDAERRNCKLARCPFQKSLQLQQLSSQSAGKQPFRPTHPGGTSVVVVQIFPPQSPPHPLHLVPSLAGAFRHSSFIFQMEKVKLQEGSGLAEVRQLVTVSLDLFPTSPPWSQGLPALRSKEHLDLLGSVSSDINC